MYPHFDTQEEGLSACSSMEPGENSQFIIRCPGLFEFHRCYWSRGQLVSRCDYSIDRAEMTRFQRLAAVELGNSLLNQEVTPNQ